MEDSSVQRLRANRCGIGSLYRTNDDSLVSMPVSSCLESTAHSLDWRSSPLKKHGLNNGKETRGDGAKNWGTFAQLSGNQATQKPPVTDTPRASSDSSLILHDDHQIALRVLFFVVILTE
jgi:hypothetical protein